MEEQDASPRTHHHHDDDDDNADNNNNADADSKNGDAWDMFDSMLREHSRTTYF